MQSQPTYTVSGNVVKTIADAQFLVWIAMARGDDKMGAEAMRVLNFLTDRAASRTDAPR